MVVSAVYDAVDLFQCVLGTTLHAEVVNNKQGIAAELIHNIVPPGKAAVQLVQDSGEACHTHRHFLLHIAMCMVHLRAAAIVVFKGPVEHCRVRKPLSFHPPHKVAVLLLIDTGF